MPEEYAVMETGVELNLPKRKELGPDTSANLDGKGIGIERQCDGSDDSSKCQAGGIEWGAKEQAGKSEPKRRKRAKNWSDTETSVLLNCIVRNRFRKGKLTYWDFISQEVGGRSREECRRRFDTLMKSFKSVHRHCEKTGQAYSELSNDEIHNGGPKLATNISEEWYNLLAKYSFREEVGKFATSGDPDGSLSRLLMGPCSPSHSAEVPTERSNYDRPSSTVDISVEHVDKSVDQRLGSSHSGPICPSPEHTSIRPGSPGWGRVNIHGEHCLYDPTN